MPIEKRTHILIDSLTVQFTFSSFHGHSFRFLPSIHLHACIFLSSTHLHLSFFLLSLVFLFFFHCTFFGWIYLIIREHMTNPPQATIVCCHYVFVVILLHKLYRSELNLRLQPSLLRTCPNIRCRIFLSKIYTSIVSGQKRLEFLVFCCWMSWGGFFFP